MWRRWFLMSAAVLSSVVLTAGTVPAARLLTAQLGEEFRLGVGRAATIEGEDLTVRFIGVREDSRCPTTVNCIWEGNAQIVVEVSKPPNDTERLALNTNPQFATKGPYLEYIVALNRLEPYPRTTRPIPEGRYRAALVVTAS
jgi:hypothetical protein